MTETDANETFKAALKNVNKSLQDSISNFPSSEREKG